MTTNSRVVRIALSIAAVAALVLVPTAVAGKGGGGGGTPDRGGGGGGGGGGSTGGVYSVAVTPSGPYSFGQQISVTTNAPIYPNNTGPWISLTCYRNGAKVLGTDHAGFPGGWYYNSPFWLGPSQAWTSGSADCTVTVFHQSNRKIVTDALTSFHVNG